MPLIANSLFESVPFCRTESEYTEMALKDIILPITQFGENNIGVNDIDIALGDTFTSNMISHKKTPYLQEDGCFLTERLCEKFSYYIYFYSNEEF